MNIQGKVYLVGGAVRDKIMRKDAKDRDYVIVDGSAENLLSQGFKKVGEYFPVFLHPETNEEYALARTERKTGLGHTGFEVETEGVSLIEDLGRRDFTINAMALSASNELIDPFHGHADIRNGIIRHVTHAFEDDPLRALRAARFAARYDFKIAPETAEAIRNIPKEDFDAISQERIYIEVTKAITDGKLNEFLTHLHDLKIDWLMGLVLTVFRASDRIPTSTDVDGTMVYLCIEALSNGRVIAPFNGIVAYRNVAKLWVEFEKSEHETGQSIEKLIRALGKFDDPKFQLLMSGLVIRYDEEYIQLRMQMSSRLYESVTSSVVLKVNPDLVGPALGDAIRNTRINLFQNFFKD